MDQETESEPIVDDSYTGIIARLKIEIKQARASEKEFERLWMQACTQLENHAVEFSNLRDEYDRECQKRSAISDKLDQCELRLSKVRLFISENTTK